MSNHNEQFPKKPPRPRLSARINHSAGRASDFIQHAATTLKPGDMVVLCCRVSELTQGRDGHLDDQERNLRAVASKCGAIVLAVAKHIGPGWDPCWLAKAVAMAERSGAKLLAESTDRFIRPDRYHSIKRPQLQAATTDLEDLRQWTEGRTLVTDLDPDATPSEVRAYQTRRGCRARSRRKRPSIPDEQRKLLDAFLRAAKTARPQRGESVCRSPLPQKPFHPTKQGVCGMS